MEHALDTSIDGFLNGDLQIEQPKIGYRAATDPVYLAASVPATQGQSVLDVGCGVGVASLCLGFRCQAILTGLEIQSNYAQLAQRNAKSNNVNFKPVLGDLSNLPLEIRSMEFDHVMTNPPFFEPRSVSRPSDSGKSIAHVETLDLKDWIKLSLKRLKPLGTFSIIQRADRLTEILSAVSFGCGDIKILPIASRSNRAAGRVLVQVKKGSKGPLELLSPFIVHDGMTHDAIDNQYSKHAISILRHGQKLNV